MCATAGEATTLSGSNLRSPTFSSSRSPGSEGDRDDVEVELVEHPGCEVLLHRARAARDRQVLVARGRPGVIERGLDPDGDEREGGAAPHRQRLAPVLGEHEHRHVVGRMSAPPASQLQQHDRLLLDRPVTTSDLPLDSRAVRQLVRRLRETTVRRSARRAQSPL
jgi:hypothetical protein